MTEVIRSSHQGDSHGGAYLVDLETQQSTKVLDWDTIDIDFSGRGQGRGLRGIVFDGDDIYIAASDELFVFDKHFKIQRSYKNRYLKHCHEICRADGRIYLTATLYDSILEFDLSSKTFTRGWLIRYAKGPNGLTLRVGRYDPNRHDGPEQADTTHLNNVTVMGEKLLVSGVQLDCLLAVGMRKGHDRWASLPRWTHNAQPCQAGVLYNSTGEDAIVYASRSGEVLKRFPVPRYDTSMLEKTDLPNDYARQAFGRGLVLTDDGMLIGSSSPSTVTAWEFDSGKQLVSVNLSLDIRNAPHGLAIWPY